MEPPDCRIPACKNHEACKWQECSSDVVYYDSPPSCAEDEKCVPGDELEKALCLDEGWFDDGKFYGSCGKLDKCPHGSTCIPPEYDKSICIPYCHKEDHPRCPENGECTRLEPSIPYDFCLPNDNCDPINDTGCEEEKSCYYLKDTLTGCFPEGNLEDGEQCTLFWECKVGHICLPTQAEENYCVKLCQSEEDCLGTSCNPLNTEYGYCY